MNHITTIIQEKKKEFEDKYRSFELCEQVCIGDRDRLLAFLDSFALALLEGVEESGQKVEDIAVRDGKMFVKIDHIPNCDYFIIVPNTLLQEAKKEI